MHLFLDCEFNGWHDQGTGELISLGLVSADGKYEFYEGVGCKNPTPFVLQHVMPILGQTTIPMWELVDKLCSFLWEVNNQEEGLITIVADYPSDIELFNRILLLGQGQCINVPVLGFLLDLSLSTKNSKIPHNALADARTLSQDYASKYLQ
ncbi:3'-5' exoribonuclease [Acinetobacter nosocomialis]|uniref:3'-5' exoribonuclease n=1 Tax=Acinetobacter nosocomialis TaxID=106654 RepID=UPI0005EB1754|nr:3'-5' exoribonuclease [Acinetobacter nosocomialis]